MQLQTFLTVLWAAAGIAACSPGSDSQSTDATADTDSPGTGTAATMTSPPDSTIFRISKGRVGFVHKGMAMAALQEQVPRQHRLTDTTLHLEGQAYEAFLLLPPQGRGLLIEQQCEPDCAVWRMRVFGKQYKTAEGIGVGSTMGEVQQFYPIKYVSLSEAGLVAVSEQAGLSFVLDASELPQERLYQLSAADIPAHLPVKQIIIY